MIENETAETINAIWDVKECPNYYRQAIVTCEVLHEGCVYTAEYTVTAGRSVDCTYLADFKFDFPDMPKEVKEKAVDVAKENWKGEPDAEPEEGEY